MTNSIIYKSFQFLIKDVIWDFFYWPIWWYSRGLLNTIKFSWQLITDQQKSLGVMIWLKNIFTPMYGQTDWEGRIISFVMRVLQVIVRSILLLLWIVVALLPIGFWVVLPAVVVAQVYSNFIVLF